MDTFPGWLTWAVGGGAGVATWAIVALLKQRQWFRAWWNTLSSEWARIVVFGFASALGGLAFAVQVWLGYVPAPGSAAGWIEAVFSIVVSQVVYAGFKVIRK